MKKAKEVFGSIIVGIIFMIGGAILLWFNEGNNVKNIKTVAEARDNVIDVTSSKVDSKNEGKLVATNGDLIVADEMVADQTFNVGIKTAKLVRTVEMYQWKEESETDDDDNTTYKYEKVWEDDIIDSSDFHKSGYDNPTSMQYQSDVFYASSIKLNEFSLNNDIKSYLSAKAEINSFENVVLPEGYSVKDKYIVSNNSDEPAIGDIRISYSYNNDEKVSVLGVQKGDEFVPFKSSQNKSIYRLHSGTLTGAEIIDSIENENNLLKWGLRILGVILMSVAGSALLAPLTFLSSLIPFFGKTISSIFGLIGALFGMALSFIVIAISWIAFRPIIGISLLVGAVALIVFGIVIFNKNKKTPTVEQVPVQQM